MRSRGLVALAALVIASSATACGGQDPASPPPPDTHARDEAIVSGFKRDFGAIVSAAAECGEDRTEACLDRALTRDAPASIVDATLRPANVATWLADAAKYVASLSKKTICSAFQYAIPWTRKFGDALRLYFLLGATGSGGSGIVVGNGEEVVWELNKHQFSTFVYDSAGVGNVCGGGASLYQGFAVSARAGDVAHSWSGYVASSQAALDIPETEFGIYLGGFSGMPVTDPLRVQGMVWGASAGVNLLNPALAVSIGGSYYKEHDDETKKYLGSGLLGHWAGSAGYHYIQYNDSRSIGGRTLSAGGLEALDILWWGFSLPQLAAATVAFGIDRLDASGQSLADWCAGEVASTSCGGGDSTTASIHPTCFTDDEVGADAPPEAPAACEADADCGPGAICTSDRANTACCRETFSAPNAPPCYSDDDCTNGTVCARGADTGDSSVLFTCIDPSAHPCDIGKP